MGPVQPGIVVFVRFPFSDLSASKLRPAVVLAQAVSTGSSARSRATPMATERPSHWQRPPSLPEDSGVRASRGRASCSRRVSPCSSEWPASSLLYAIASWSRES